MAVIGVVGLGVMGLGIVQVFASAGHQVLATDGYLPVRDSAISRLRAGLEPRVSAGKMTQTDMQDILARVTIKDIAAFAPCDLIIEAVAEKLDLKQALFVQLEPISNGVFATNTSSLSVADIAQSMTNPARLIGLHFFNPAPVMKLVELISTPQNGPAALAMVRDICISAGKTVVTCADRPGFIVNRCARPYYGEALAMLEEGRVAADIDAAMVAAGYRLGPFALIDLIGADINLAATEGLFAAMNGHPRYHVFDALRRQVAKGDLGRKTGRGFVFPDAPGQAPPDADQIVLRIEAALANEAASLLAEGGTDQAAIDTALRLGLNFPRGAFDAAKAQGIDAVLAMLTALETNAPPHLKGRYLPQPALRDLA